MRHLLAFVIVVVMFLLVGCAGFKTSQAKLLPVEKVTTAAVRYPWLAVQPDPITHNINVITPKAGYLRLTANKGTFGEWVQHLPLKAGNPTVRTYDGMEAPNQWKHAQVVDIDAGKDNLQQSSNAILRLRAEYLFAKDRLGQINFPTKGGKRIDFRTWAKEKKLNTDHTALIAYLNEVFAHADAKTLAAMLKPVADIHDMEPGDVMVKQAEPSYALLIMDVVEDPATKKRYFTLGTSHMPAQDFYVIINPSDSALSPWYPQAFGKSIGLPEGVFQADELMRF